MHETINYVKLTAGDFASAMGAVFMTTFDLPAIDDTVIVAVLHADDGSRHAIARIPVATIEDRPEMVTEKIIEHLHTEDHEPGDLIARIVVVSEDETPAVLALSTVAEAVENFGIPVADRIITPRISTGQPWRDMKTGDKGYLPDPAMTAPALAAYVDGAGLLPDPYELEELFDDIEAVETAAARAERRANPARFARDTLLEIRKLIGEYVNAAESDQHSGAVIGIDAADEVRAYVLNRTAEGLAARTGVLAHESPAARDALLGLAVIDIQAAARIYTHIANQHHGMDRAHMLAIAAVLYHADGHPYHAREALYRVAVAVESEMDQTAPPVFARTLAAAAVVDAEIDTARRILANGSQAAKRFGIDTPVYDLYPAE